MRSDHLAASVPACLPEWAECAECSLFLYNVTEGDIGAKAQRHPPKDNINLRRDVEENLSDIEELYDEIEDLWDEEENSAKAIGAISKLQQRIALLENDLKYINRDHDNVINKNNH